MDLKNKYLYIIRSYVRSYQNLIMQAIRICDIGMNQHTTYVRSLPKSDYASNSYM